MKKIVIVILLVGLGSSQLLAQQDRSFYEAKLARYTKMKKTGTILTAAGVGLTLAGIVMMSTAEYETIDDGFGGSTRVSSDPQAIIGAISLLGGMGMMGPGIPLAIIGSKKTKQYSEKLNTISIDMKASPQRAAIGLTFKF